MLALQTHDCLWSYYRPWSVVLAEIKYSSCYLPYFWIVALIITITLPRGRPTQNQQFGRFAFPMYSSCESLLSFYPMIWLWLPWYLHFNVEGHRFWLIDKNATINVIPKRSEVITSSQGHVSHGKAHGLCQCGSTKIVAEKSGLGGLGWWFLSQPWFLRARCRVGCQGSVQPSLATILRLGDLVDSSTS